MKMVSGAILILASEQAFSHAFLIGFPYQSYAESILHPFAATAFLTGLGLLVYGFWGDRQPS
jgi:hypothetical protein